MRKEIREKIKKGDLNFQGYHFPKIDFTVIPVKFKRQASFNNAVFHGDVNFGRTTFLDDVKFGGARFLGDVNFGDAKFAGWAWFDSAEFSNRTSFFGTEFLGPAWFYAVKFSGGAKLDFTFSRIRSFVTFDGRVLSKARLNFRNTLFERGLMILNEDIWSKCDFRLMTETAESYHALRRGFKNMGRYRVAGELFYREMICRRNMISISEIITYSDSIGLPKWLRNLIQTFTRIKPLLPVFNRMALFFKVRVKRNDLINWLWMRLFDITCGFGERPKRILLGCVLTVLIFTGLYFPIVDSTSILRRVQTAFLLSLDAFTPGKFLNISFTSPGEWLVQIETVLGWFMLSLFLLVFTRKMSRG